MSIQIWNRYTGREEAERVYGDWAVRMLYGNAAGFGFADSVLARPWFSRVYGGLQSSRASRRKIAPFIRDFEVAMNEFEERDYSSFNEFFIRKFRPGMRPFVAEAGRMPAFAEARYLAFEALDEEALFPVKGIHLSAQAVLGADVEAGFFRGGPMMIARLCPVDYHRFHYPDAGQTLATARSGDRLHSVNPVALARSGTIFARNERVISVLQTENFGRLAYVEVGALCVGKIVQTHDASQPFVRGGEKGYFLFGGSTVLLFGEPGRWKPDDDLLRNTRNRIETFVKLGDGVARATAL